MHRAEMRGALLGRPASTPTAPLRLRCPVWASSTSRTSDGRLTPRPSPAHQPRTASMAPPRALADGRDGTERPDLEAHLVDCADRAAEQLPPDTRSMTGLARGAPPAGAPPRRPPPRSGARRDLPLVRRPNVRAPTVGKAPRAHQRRRPGSSRAGAPVPPRDAGSCRTGSNPPPVAPHLQAKESVIAQN